MGSLDVLILGSPSQHDDNNSDDDDGNNDDDDDDEDDRPGGEAGAFESCCSRSGIQDGEHKTKVIWSISCHRSHISFVVDAFYGDTNVGINGVGHVFVVRRISCESEGAPFRSI